MDTPTPTPPTTPRTPDPDDPLAALTEKQETEYRQLTELFTKLHEEAKRCFAALHASSQIDHSWASYSYTQFELSMLTAKKSLDDGIRTAREGREAMARRSAQRNAGLN